ncbi:MAG: phosphohydrolase [Rhizobacter sp.]|nr:phosphohydrolase [Rhizobacter sp.]
MKKLRTAMLPVEQLCIGLFVHLDLGWMSHPFPLGSFKIASVDQIETIRSLGLTQVRICPEKSDLMALPPSMGGNAGALEPAAPVSAFMTALAAEPLAPEVAAERQRREVLAAHREATLVCDRQFEEAGHVFAQASDMLQSDPVRARVHSETLTRTLVDKMLIDGELCIRLLSESPGDRACTHSVNVAVVSLLMGRTFGLPESDLLDLGVGALLHDIGKSDVPAPVRHRDGRMSQDELLHYQQHVAHGVSQARRMGLAPGALLVIAQHHEHSDGRGFPLHIGSDRMTAASRIVAMVNRYDNLCNPQVPAHALTPHEAVSLMFAQDRDKFDTTMLGCFIKMMGVYPAGSVVQLTDDRFALVMSVNSTRPLKPRVLVHDKDVPPEEAVLLDLELEPRIGIRRSLKPAALPRDVLAYLSPRQSINYFFEAARSVESMAEAA